MCVCACVCALVVGCVCHVWFVCVPGVVVRCCCVLFRCERCVCLLYVRSCFGVFQFVCSLFVSAVVVVFVLSCLDCRVRVCLRGLFVCFVCVVVWLCVLMLYVCGLFCVYVFICVCLCV